MQSPEDEKPSVPDKDLKKAMLYCFSTAVHEEHGHSHDHDQAIEAKVDEYLKQLHKVKGSNLKRDTIIEDYNMLGKNRNYLK